ncbi:hypothetical protein LGH70_13585 [Hymenobacter sp. BT635]|uniref:Uncharacterized protein n=1 Tax=Hymenobacter nitidus TaxID=2880929 RepID=A0ABS8AFZ4_9BACT|nr:hypothetical protein [Hymenobacter nitidus]MCB2378627.1 hypothetical protein [Hymenobacter nitidus]
MVSYSLQAQPSILGRDLPVSLQAYAVPPPPEPFYIRRVIEAQPRQRGLGISKFGLFAPYRMLVVAQGVGPELTAALRARLPASAAAQPLVLRLTSINASSLLANGKLNTAGELAAEYYAQRPDSSYYLVARTYATDQQQVTATTPEQSAPLLLAALLQQSLEQVSRADWTQPGPAYTLAQLQQPGTAPYPIRTETWRMGIYRSFFEFRHNEPGRPDNVSVDARAYRNTEWQGKRAVNPSVLTPEGKHVALTDAWGFCDGRQVYIQFQGEYYLLEQRGPNFMFFAPDFNNTSGGVINAGPPRKAFSLDMRTGLILDYQGTEGAATNLAQRPTHLIVYRRRPGPSLPVSIDNGAVGQLGTDQYLSIPWQAAGQPVHLCVGEACLEVVPDPNAPTYLELRPEGGAKLVAVPARQGEEQVNKLADR